MVQDHGLAMELENHPQVSEILSIGFLLTQTHLDILSLLPPANVALLSHILEHKVKPLFRSNPHPDLNLSTGRKLSRPAGGPMASQDYYENQTWKNAPGAANLLSWCVRHLEVKAGLIARYPV